MNLFSWFRLQLAIFTGHDIIHIWFDKGNYPKIQTESNTLVLNLIYVGFIWVVPMAPGASFNITVIWTNCISWNSLRSNFYLQHLFISCIQICLNGHSICFKWFTFLGIVLTHLYANRSYLLYVHISALLALSKLQLPKSWAEIIGKQFSEFWISITGPKCFSCKAKLKSIRIRAMLEIGSIQQGGKY